MKCEYCEKELKKGAKYCDFCGAKVDFAEGSKETVKEESATSTKDKKKLSPGKIILIVFLVSTFIVAACFGLGYLLFSAVLDRTDYKYDDSYSFEYDNEDEFYDYFSQYFDSYFGNQYSYDDEYGKSDYKYVENYKAPTIDRDTNSYTSEFGNLKIQFPTNWEMKTNKELKEIYSEQGVPSKLYSNNLFVYDVYAVDTFTGASFYVSFYNADYFDDYDDIKDFNKKVKDSTLSYETEGFTVDYADDSKITINNTEYSQLAARITTEDKCFYAYDFTRLVDGYYMQISIFTYDIDTVGKVIDFVANK